MYAQHFGLEREPFSIAPDPRYLFMSERHREALAHLLFGVGGGGGFVLLTGEIGAGKTTVCRCFLEQVPAHCDVAYIFNPKLTVQELLQTVCEEFKVAVAARGGAGMPSLKDHVDALNRFLLDGHAAGRSRVLIIDEAQNLAPEVLEQLRLLTNLETHERKLLQIVLIGQPELRAMLQRPDLEQLAQRVLARYHLQALSEVETLQYIEHRLTVAGLKAGLPFDRKALQRIHHHARGVPRRINLLCDRALLGAYGARRERVDRAIVEQAAEEVFGIGSGAGGEGPGLAGAWVAWKPAGAVLAGLVALVGIGWLAVTALQTGSTPARREARIDAAPSASTASSANPILPGASAGAAGVAGAVPAAAAVSPPAPAASAEREGDGPLTTSGAALLASDTAGSLAMAAGSAPDASPGRAEARLRSEAVDGLPAWDEGRDAALLFADEAAGWRALAARWGETLQAGDACIAAARVQLQCFRAEMPLSLLVSLGRPGLVGLRLADGRRRQALLVGLDDSQAVLALGTASVRLSRTAFGAAWDGQFATFWRSPLGYVAEDARNLRGAAALWLADQLQAHAAGAEPGAVTGADTRASSGSGAGVPTRPAPAATDTAELRRRLMAFQRAWGLEADGRLGPMTFMQLNRAAQVQEPRLTTAGGLR